MVVRLRFTICLLLAYSLVFVSTAYSQEGFLFRNRATKGSSPAGSYYQGIIPHATRTNRIELAVKPETTATDATQTENKSPAENEVNAGDAKNKTTANTVADESGVGNGCDGVICGDCGDAGCCDVSCDDEGCCASGCGGLGYECDDEIDFFRSGKFYVRGWIDQGMTFNSASSSDRANGPVGYNWRSNDYTMNQLYTTIGRDVCANGCFWDAGGRVDLLYGTDYRYTEALGLETDSLGDPHWNGLTPGGHEALYGLSMPQIYAEFAVPFAQATTFKFGHFYSIIGYESPMAPQNFFYSHSYMKVYGEPATETGMLASTKIAQNLVLHAGLSRGWDMWENPNHTTTFIGGICWTSTDERTSLGFAIDTGDLEENENRTILSLVFTKQLGERWTYVLQYDFGSQEDAFVNQQGQAQKADWYGLNNYIFYSLSKTLSAGMRVEWFCDADRYIVFETEGSPALSGSDYCEITLGLNWQPTKCVMVRPELRWDWSDVKGSEFFPFRPYNDYTSSSQFLFATDLIVRF